jgi:hypothetical protein
MVRPRTARRELSAEFGIAREGITQEHLSRYHRKLILRRFDEYVQQADDRLKRAIIFTRPQFHRLWDDNTYIFISSRVVDRCNNTAAMIISVVLRRFGLRHGFLKKEEV